MDRKTGKLYLSQRMYLEKVLDRFNVGNCNSVSTPVATYFKLSDESCPTSRVDMKKMS